jgi:hypothetical protein
MFHEALGYRNQFTQDNFEDHMVLEQMVKSGKVKRVKNKFYEPNSSDPQSNHPYDYVITDQSVLDSMRDFVFGIK